MTVHRRSAKVLIEKYPLVWFGEKTLPLYLDANVLAWCHCLRAQMIINSGQRIIQNDTLSFLRSTLILDAFGEEMLGRMQYDEQRKMVMMQPKSISDVVRICSDSSRPLCLSGVW